MSFRVLAQACGVVMTALLVFYAWGWQQTQQMQQDLAQLEGQLKQRNLQVTSLGNQLAEARTGAAPQQQALERLEQELVARQKVVAALQRVRDSYTRGVSSYLEGFARQAPKGVWLTGFRVQGGGEGLVIRGSSLEPALIPAFIQQLSAEPALAGTHFGLLQIQRDKPQTGYVDFTVYTGADAPQFPAQESGS